LPRLETGSGPFQADAFLPDIGSIGLSLIQGPLGSLTRGRRDSSFCAHQAPRPPRWDGSRLKVRDWKDGASPSLALKKPEDPETKTKTQRPMEQRQPAAAPFARQAAKDENGADGSQ
jgi:hypothetical protein